MRKDELFSKSRIVLPDIADLTGEDEYNDGYLSRSSPVTVREQRVAKPRRIVGFNKPQRSSGDQAGQAAAEDHRITEVSEVLQLLRHPEGAVVRKALQWLRVRWHHCEPERLQSLLRAAGASARACNLVPQVVQPCQVCRAWRGFGRSNKFIYSFALAFNEEVQFDLTHCQSRLEPGLGGIRGIPTVH